MMPRVAATFQKKWLFGETRMTLRSGTLGRVCLRSLWASGSPAQPAPRITTVFAMVEIVVDVIEDIGYRYEIELNGL